MGKKKLRFIFEKSPKIKKIKFILRNTLKIKVKKN